MSKPRVLIVDDDRGLVKELEANLEEDFDSEAAFSFCEAVDKLASTEYSVLISDRKLPDTHDGAKSLIKHLQSQRVRPEIIVLTAYADIPDANELFHEGAFSYIEKGRAAFDQLRDDCKKASRRWHQRYHRIPDSAIKDTMAVLIGELVINANKMDLSDLQTDAEWLRKVLDRAAFGRGGYLVKLALPTFLVAFGDVSSTVEVFYEIRRELGTRFRFGAPLQIHAVLGWGKVTKVHRAHGDELVGPGVSETFKLLDDTVQLGAYRLSPSAERQLHGKPPTWVEFALQEADRLADVPLPTA